MQCPPLQCHDSRESCINSLAATPLTILHRGASLPPSHLKRKTWQTQGNASEVAFEDTASVRVVPAVVFDRG